VGESVAVIGLGLLGLLAVQIAAAAGGRVIGVDIDPRRVELAKGFGVQAVPREQAEEAVLAFTSNLGADVVLICADTPSNDPLELAGAIARNRAKIVATGAVGLTMPRKVYYEKELNFINSRSYGPGRYDPAYEENGQDYPIGYVRWTEGRNFQTIVELLGSGKLNIASLISHRFPIERAAEAYEVITGKKKESFLGVLLKYSDAPDGKMATRVEFDAPRLPQAAVKLGVLGAGLFANATLLPAIKKQKEVDLVGIASVSGLHAQHSGQKFGFAYAASDDEQLLNDPNINTVAILTRHNTHAELVLKALQAGKNVFVEKPLAITREQLSAVSEALMVDGCPLLTVGFNRRFAPLATELAGFLAERREPLHAHYRINAGALPLNHWTQNPAVGGGRIIGEGCHFVDFITFLVGSVPVSVTAGALPDGGKYREDNVSMTFTFADGSIGVVDYLANGDKSFPKERLEVFCGGRIAVLEDFRSLEMVRDGHRKTIRQAQAKGWSEEWAAFSKAIRTGGNPTIPYEQLIGVTKATFAAIESLRSGNKIKVE
jgi:predicted dehydrogenase